uniref:Uncharacterized protein n=1 Tax=Arundo donax TaxID=35708 RepID=A0A0A9BJI4_ARUDO
MIDNNTSTTLTDTKNNRAVAHPGISLFFTESNSFFISFIFNFIFLNSCHSKLDGVVASNLSVKAPAT